MGRVWRERRRKEWSLGGRTWRGVLETSEKQFQGSGISNQPEGRRSCPEVAEVNYCPGALGRSQEGVFQIWGEAEVPVLCMPCCVSWGQSLSHSGPRVSISGP